MSALGRIPVRKGGHIHEKQIFDGHNHIIISLPFGDVSGGASCEVRICGCEAQCHFDEDSRKKVKSTEDAEHIEEGYLVSEVRENTHYSEKQKEKQR